MKASKRETTLNERDALTDLLEAEKLLMSYYAAAVTEGSSKPFRKEILKHYSSSAETQFTVFEQMLSRGYYKTQPAEKAMLEEKKAAFSKALKEIG